MYNIQIIIIFIIIITDSYYWFYYKIKHFFRVDLLDEREEFGARELSGWGSKENSKNSRVIQRET